MASKDTALVPEPEDNGGGYLTTFTEGAEMGQVLRENMGDTLTPFDLIRIKIPAGGGKQFTVPTLEGEEDVNTISGVIVNWRTMRAYWEEDFETTGGGVPPDCSSQDGVVGVGDPGGLCSECPMNVFGTANHGRGRGKACKEMRALFVMTEGAKLPYMFLMPPSSIKPIKNYMLKLVSNGAPYWSVETTFELKKVSNKDNIAYSELAPTFNRKLDPDERQAANYLKDQLTPVLDAVSVEITSDDAAADAAAG